MSVADLAKQMMGAIGENFEGGDPTHWLDTGFEPLNQIITGDHTRGFPGGRIVEIYGPSSAGKTVFATLAMKQAQLNGGIAGFNDHERAFRQDFAAKMGLNITFPHFIYKQPRTWEESNMVAMKAAETIRKSGHVPDSAPIVWVIDSIAACIPQSVYEKGIDEYTMNDTTALARVASTTLKAVAQFVADFNVTMIYLNQVRTKPGIAYGDPTTTPGGVAMEFYASLRLSLSRKKVMEEVDKTKEFIGQIITIETKKNRLARPFQKTELRLMFDEEGMAFFDFTTSLIEHCLANGLLTEPSKGWIQWSDGKKYTKKQLSTMIDAEGKQAELKALFNK